MRIAISLTKARNKREGITRYANVNDSIHIFSWWYRLFF